MKTSLMDEEEKKKISIERKVMKHNEMINVATCYCCNRNWREGRKLKILGVVIE